MQVCSGLGLVFVFDIHCMHGSAHQCAWFQKPKMDEDTDENMCAGLLLYVYSAEDESRKHDRIRQRYHDCVPVVDTVDDRNEITKLSESILLRKWITHC